MATDSDARTEPDDAVADSLDGDFGLARTIEGLLFVADRALSAAELGGVTGASDVEVQAALRELIAHYRTRGIVLLEHRNAFRLVSAPDLADHCRRLLGLDQRRQPSRAALETLGIVAYRGQATRAEIERVRGVDSDSALASLLARNLIREAGRLDAPGRPAVFTTTDTFLAYFGLTSLDELPELDLDVASDEAAVRPPPDV
ncbi:MAG: SMC-Scp complex subunit ScpB [Chloroflexota bacterium]|nr:SMC-Scp complex subunit ScpB [Rhodospirillaceae bacterium]MDE2766882.1 SMC-Scp complex subunit ScpB [Chloroflexota bacterium]